MSVTPQSSRAVVLIKALPQPSKTYGETVCCAGVTADGQWKRLFPVRFRHLRGEASFSRWDWVSFSYRPPTRDARMESCHVHEESISIDGHVPSTERGRILRPLIRKSAIDAMSAGHSLTLIKPRNSKFIAKRKTTSELEDEREAYRLAANQGSFFDKELAEFELSPYDFRFRFEDDGGSHDYQNGDWETHVMFWKWRQLYGEAETLKRMSGVFNDEYPKKGMLFALGNQAKRPQTWQLLGVIRYDEPQQDDLFGS
jgi:hypothetical protein